MSVHPSVSSLLKVEWQLCGDLRIVDERRLLAEVLPYPRAEKNPSRNFAAPADMPISLFVA